MTILEQNIKTYYNNTVQRCQNIPMFTQNMVFYPTNKIRVPVNKENVLKSGIVKIENADLIVEFILILTFQQEDYIRINY